VGELLERPEQCEQAVAAFPSDYGTLPTVSFVVPNEDNDMHDGPIDAGDAWVREHLDGFVDWALANNSLFILTFDEDDFSPQNHIPTLFVGSMVEPGTYAQTIDHVDVLRTIEDMYGLPHAGASGAASPITYVWNDCGNGVADPGEECGEPSLACGVGATCRACACVNETICQSSIILAEPTLVMRAEPFLLTLKGEAMLPKPWIGVHPMANGIHLEIDEPVGTGGIHAVLPGGPRWHRNKKATKWRYSDPSGSISGITRVILSDYTIHQDGLQIVVKGKDGTVALPHPQQARVAVVLGTADECATAAFDGISASCSGDSSLIKCR
jgi:hypothetical protein